MPAIIEAEPIQYEVDGHVARIWLNRPHKRNAVSQQLLRSSTRRGRAEEDENVRVMVSAAGVDVLLGLRPRRAAGRLHRHDAAYEIAQVGADLRRDLPLAKPSVAVVEGYTTAGGFEIMINCDFAIAEENAKIGDFHIRRALFGGAGPMYRLPRILGERKAKELMMTGKLLSGREADEFGLMNDWAPAAELDARVDDFVADLVDKSPFQMRSRRVRQPRSRRRHGDADARRAPRRRRHLNSDDAAEGVAAFLDKREAAWTGSYAPASRAGSRWSPGRRAESATGSASGSPPRACMS